MANVYDIEDHDIYQDLMRCFCEHGHKVYIVTGAEKRKGLETELYDSCGCSILRVKVGNQSNCSLIEKGLATISLQSKYFRAISKHLRGVKFDLILYATPPITLVSLVSRIKKKNKCISYLMLKDIFPQNAVDLGMISEGGIVYRYFRRKEMTLYRISDVIGCMSEANVEYLLQKNSIDRNKVEICPNALLPREKTDLSPQEKNEMKERFGIPLEKLVLVFGGNLGKPQGIDFLIDCLKSIKDDANIFTIIVGDGSEFQSIEKAIHLCEINNVLLLRRLPRDEYLKMCRLADVGMIFLDYRFTIPNFPSRILPYMENEMPILCATDDVTDIGTIVEKNGFGWKCKSNSISGFLMAIERIKHDDIKMMGKRGKEYLKEYFNTETCYQKIMEKVLRKK